MPRRKERWWPTVGLTFPFINELAFPSFSYGQLVERKECQLVDTILFLFLFIQHILFSLYYVCWIMKRNMKGMFVHLIELTLRTSWSLGWKKAGTWSSDRLLFHNQLQLIINEREDCDHTFLIRFLRELSFKEVLTFLFLILSLRKRKKRKTRSHLFQWSLMSSFSFSLMKERKEMVSADYLFLESSVELLIKL